MRGALTGVAGLEGVVVFPEVSDFSGVLTAGLPGLELLAPGLLEPAFVEPLVVFGRRLLGLAVLPEVAGLSFGRDVRNAPRTSSSWITGAAVPITSAQTQTSPKTITLNRITNLLIMPGAIKG